MLNIISIDYVPGVCDSIIPYFQRDRFVVLPTHTDIIKRRNITSGIVSCIHNIVSRLQHIKRCNPHTMSSNDAVVCTHWFDIPMAVLGTPVEERLVKFMARHTRDLIRAFGIEYRHIPVILRVTRDECLERLISNMDGEEVGIHHIDLYQIHLNQVPNTFGIDIPQDGLYIRYICERVVDTIEKILHGL
jgi:hypothetical protein